MPEHEHNDGTKLTTDDLDTLHNVVAVTNSEVADAVSAMVGYADHSHPEMAVDRTHGELIDAYGSLTSAIDRAEVQLDRAEYGGDTPRRIKSEHADRIEETYDLPVMSIALMLLEANRREWLHGKPETNGADEVRRHGLTSTQRDMLNRFQDWSEAADAIEDTIPVLRGEAEELREREDFDDHLEDVAESLDHRADRLEERIEEDRR